MTELPKTYEPASVESRIYQWWLDNGWFSAEQNSGEPRMCIVIPPPNVTGALHMGHALNGTIQDAMIRRSRMMGFATLWLPGTDHAGIATQNVVEKRLAAEGTNRHELGREKFVERVWAWKDEYEARILEQFKRLGCSCDWDRTRFTMDEGLTRAVREVFVRLFEDGLIYRGNRIINWCPRCTTAISDIEVRHEDVEGELVTISYPLTDGSGAISVATTRVETMLGDTAVAVNPSDERYKALVGKTATLPLMGREIPIIADDAVDSSFGTGAVKVTPAHDPNDFDIAQRHSLEAINIFDKTATVNENGGQFKGLDRFAARKAVYDALDKQDRIVKTERPYLHSVGHCDRCDTIVEPWLSEQWFVKMKPLAQPAADAVRNGDVKFVPHKRFAKTYLDWMDNIRDWTISRQLWWGHRIPVWYCNDGHVFAAREDPTQCAECGITEIEQDPDVLDTWFSAWLWPFSTLGWPEETKDLKDWYPTTTLVTAYDIIYLWVARMIAAGLYLMGKPPFKTIVINGIVRDVEGKKISKSKGNAVDPIDWIDRFGTDALRFTLARSAIPGQDTNVAEDWIEGDRRFANKIYNAARFVLINPEGNGQPDDSLAGRWIRSRLAHAGAAVNKGFDENNLADAARPLYDFIWSEFCDWYVEASKLDPARSATTLRETLKTSLQLLHPIMPFITEELWQQLGGDGSIMISKWPETTHRDPEAESQMATVIETVLAIRSFRHSNGYKTRDPISMSMTGTTEAIATLQSELTLISSLAKIEKMTFGEQRADLPTKLTVSFGELWLPQPAPRYEQTTEKRKAAAAETVEKARAKLNNPAFVNKAPEEVVAKVKRDLAEALAILDITQDER